MCEIFVCFTGHAEVEQISGLDIIIIATYELLLQFQKSRIFPYDWDYCDENVTVKCARCCLLPASMLA